MNYTFGTRKEAIKRGKEVSYFTTIFSLHLPSFPLPPYLLFFSLTQVLFQLLLAVSIKCSNQRAGVGDYREGWVCSRTSFKYEPDCTGSSGMSWLVMSCSITCSTSSFTILSAPLSRLLFFMDLFPYWEFSPTPNWAVVSTCACFCLWVQQSFADPLLGRMESATRWTEKKPARLLFKMRKSLPIALFCKEDESADSYNFILNKAAYNTPEHSQTLFYK